MTETMVTCHLRPFADADYVVCVAINNRVFPDHPETEAEWRHYASTFDTSRFFRLRVVAESPNGTVLGWGQLHHMPGQFHPDKYRLNVQVDPPYHGRGIGTAIYAQLLGVARARGAVAIRTFARESMRPTVDFALRRGFVEMRRSWESRLDVGAFDAAPFASAGPRVDAQGVTLTTLAAERERDPNALGQAYDLFCDCDRDVPSVDPVTAEPFEKFVRNEVEGPNAVLDGFFLAIDQGRYLAVSSLFKTEADRGVLYQGLTGVRREARGRGLAMALKLETVAYAKANGYREIRTWNDTANQPMLRINEAMGFARQPAWIEFEQRLG